MKEYYYFYILERSNGSFYYGATNNVGFRFCRHLKGLVKSTAKFRPLKLIYIEIFENKKLAFAREREVKAWKSHRKVVELIGSVGSPANGV